MGRSRPSGAAENASTPDRTPSSAWTPPSASMAGIAHEINNPINFIASGVPSLRRDIGKLASRVPDAARDARFGRIHDRIERLLGAISNGTDRTVAIVAGLRSFSRHQHAEIAETDLHEGLDSTLMLLRNQTRDRVEISTNYEELPPVWWGARSAARSWLRAYTPRRGCD